MSRRGDWQHKPIVVEQDLRTLQISHLPIDWLQSEDFGVFVHRPHHHHKINVVTRWRI